jgi:hypothetical protein
MFKIFKRLKPNTTITITTLILTLAITTLITQEAEAGITVFKDGDKYLKIGGRIQLQYHSEKPDDGETTDELFFRRLRPYIEGSIHEDWLGKFQWDMGGSSGDNELVVKDAYLQYKGLKGHKVTIGNANFPFSRELLTSSKKQQLVERTFVGDHNYGTPNRNLGVHVTGGALDKKITYGVSVASASIDPDDDKLDFDTPVNKDSDFNEGWIFGGRVDLHPLGNLKMSQGDFQREPKFTIGVSAFVWNNDDDNNTYTDPATNLDTSGGSKPDVHEVTGFEASTALRLYGFSLDAEYNIFDAETIDPSVTSGIWENGEADLENWAIEGGFMVLRDKLEIVGAFQSQDANGYMTEWERTSVGVNYFFKKHDIKIQTTYRMNDNVKGVPGDDEDELFVQMQFVF